MKIEVTGEGKIICSGAMDESLSGSELKAIFEKLRPTLGAQPLAVDFANVRSANSNGVVNWLRFLDSTRHPVKYQNAPIWMVRQFNMLQQFFAFGSFAESITVPFHSTTGTESIAVVLKLGSEIELRPNYRDFELPPRVIQGESYAMDCDPEAYFAFITSRYSHFKEALARQS